MSQYKLTIKIAEATLKTLAEDDNSLCIQKYVNDGSSKPVANIVVNAIAPGQYSNMTTFTWKDEYSMAATQNPYQEGATLAQTTTDPLNISTMTQDAFTLTTWADYSVVHDSALAPPKGFAFLPNTQIPGQGASAVVYLSSLLASGQTPATQVPFYISPVPCIGGSQNQLIPVEQVIVFFSSKATGGTMISTGRAFEQIVDLTTESTQSWTLNDQKEWVQDTL